LKNPFRAHIGDQFQDFFGKIGIDNNLNKSKAVTHVKEDYPAVVAATMDPARQGDSLTGVGGS
jgi:hypothetical protein